MENYDLIETKNNYIYKDFYNNEEKDDFENDYFEENTKSNIEVVLDTLDFSDIDYI